MSRVDQHPTREEDNPLARFCDRHPLYDQLDKVLFSSPIFVLVTVALGILTGVILKWVFSIQF